MTAALVRTGAPHRPLPRTPRPDVPGSRARDWAEIQERMLVPLYEAVYERLEVDAGTRLLGLDCGSGLALLLAARRGAAVTGLDGDPPRLALARARLTAGLRYEHSLPGGELPGVPARPFTLITSFERPRARALAGAAAVAERGSPVVLAERCATAPVLRLGDPGPAWLPPGGDDLEDVARAAGLRPAGAGRVACPFGYADPDSAVRGLLSTGYFDGALRALDEARVTKELTEALHPYRRTDGTVWMPNVLRYLIAYVQDPRG